MSVNIPFNERKTMLYERQNNAYFGKKLRYYTYS